MRGTSSHHRPSTVPDSYPRQRRAFRSGLYCARPIPIECRATQREREGDIEAAQYALEPVPAHAEYGERLTREQRATLEKNGERILERISVLKDAIMQRQEDYMRTSQRQPARSNPPPAESIPQSQSQSYSTSDII
ncbi:hypothetical protein BDZ89DRAFT_1128405 [Hymenopellis radicata]|nr:hypothetical protein BDZ89DRAFT_1128405 [Hymenopellis radicata]